MLRSKAEGEILVEEYSLPEGGRSLWDLALVLEMGGAEGSSRKGSSRWDSAKAKGKEVILCSSVAAVVVRTVLIS